MTTMMCDTFYAKRIIDINLAADPTNGGFTETAPYVGIQDAGLGGRAGPVGWGVAQPLVLWYLYRYYGNVELIRESYNASKAWIELLKSRAGPGLLLNNGLSDWMSTDPTAPILTGTGFFYASAVMQSRFASIVGNAADAQEYAALAQRIAEASHAAFYNASSAEYGAPGTGVVGTDCAQSMPLYMGMVPDAATVAAVAGAAVKRLRESSGGHFMGGMFAMKWWTLALTDAGYVSVSHLQTSASTHAVAPGLLRTCSAPCSKPASPLSATCSA
jgi:alpha-L-rhamnosidase